MSDPDDALFNAINEALTRGCCYYCGDKAEGRIEGSCQGAYCPRCDIFLVATSYFLPIREDPTSSCVTQTRAIRDTSVPLPASPIATICKPATSLMKAGR